MSGHHRGRCFYFPTANRVVRWWHIVFIRVNRWIRQLERCSIGPVSGLRWCRGYASIVTHILRISQPWCPQRLSLCPLSGCGARDGRRGGCCPMWRCWDIGIYRIELLVGIRGRQSSMGGTSWLAKGRSSWGALGFLQGARNGLDLLLASLVPLAKPNAGVAESSSFVPCSRGTLPAIQEPARAPALCIAMRSATGMFRWRKSREETDLANFILPSEPAAWHARRWLEGEKLRLSEGLYETREGKVQEMSNRPQAKMYSRRRSAAAKRKVCLATGPDWI